MGVPKVPRHKETMTSSAKSKSKGKVIDVLRQLNISDDKIVSVLVAVLVDPSFQSISKTAIAEITTTINWQEQYLRDISRWAQHAFQQASKGATAHEVLSDWVNYVQYSIDTPNTKNQASDNLQHQQQLHHQSNHHHRIFTVVPFHLPPAEGPPKLT